MLECNSIPPVEVALFLAEGFEEIEASTPICFLRHMGISLQTVSIGEKRVVGAHGIPFEADVLLDEVTDFTYKMIVLPGGVPGAFHLASHPALGQLITRYVAAGGWIAANCAAPMVLGQLGLLQNRRIVCYPGFEEYMKGATILSGCSSCVDGHIITANGPASSMELAYRVACVLRGEEPARQMAEMMMVNWF